MNVYDFDKTIYDGDSTLDFYFYCLKKRPSIASCLPRQLWGAFRYALKQIDKTRFKEEFYCFFKHIGETDMMVKDFWDCHENNIKSWYKEQHRDDDLIISASPYFLLREICDRLEIKYLIASEVDRYTGKYSGKNCYGEEKVKRFNEQFQDETIDQFYSDSKSDVYLARLAKKSWIVEGEKLREW